ncbi:MAG TPA: homoserine kinase [Burkholderiales bacterium]|nr:homoserine kinase [Burkholderiales bacterium]
MSVFTPVTPEQLAPWLARYPVGTLRSLRGIAEGIENTNYLVETDAGCFVLTLFERLSPAALPFYLDLMTHLGAHGFPCPRPVADDRGGTLGELKDKPACLATFLPGRPLAAPAAAECEAVGTMLAELHLKGAGFPGAPGNPRGRRWWKEAAGQATAQLAPEDAALLAEELRFQSLYRFPDLPRGVIHADLFRDNVLWSGGRVSGVLDFYFACADVLLYDVAIAANDWCVTPDGTLEPTRTRALLAGYHARRPLTAIERGAWPVLLRAGALRFWLSRLLDCHAPRRGELTYTKNPDQFRDILRLRVRAHGELPRVWV